VSVLAQVVSAATTTPTTSTAEIPDWLGVITSVVLVGIAAVIALRQRLGITRELLIARPARSASCSPSVPC
jgi:hypothetical protein